jgi:hypothetical protein
MSCNVEHYHRYMKFLVSEISSRTKICVIWSEVKLDESIRNCRKQMTRNYFSTVHLESLSLPRPVPYTLPNPVAAMINTKTIDSPSRFFVPEEVDVLVCVLESVTEVYELASGGMKFAPDT